MVIKHLDRAHDLHLSIWMIPIVGIFFIGTAWFIAYSLAQDVGEGEKAAFEQARLSQVESCERVNLLREEVNTVVDVLQTFLLEAVTARQAAGSETDIQAAEAYQELANRIRPLEIPDCEQVIRDYLAQIGRL